MVQTQSKPILPVKMTLISLVFLLLSGCTSLSQGYLPEEQTNEPTSLPILGEWNQYMLVNQDFLYGGTFVVSEKDGSLEMHQSIRRDGTHVQMNSYSVNFIFTSGLTNVAYDYDREEWRFDSDWGSRGTGHFSLFKRTEDIYEGWSSQNDRNLTFNRWERPRKD